MVTGVGVTSNVVVRLVRSAVVTGTVVAGGKPVGGVGVGIRVERSIHRAAGKLRACRSLDRARQRAVHPHAARGEKPSR